jgi:hypothetical protein
MKYLVIAIALLFTVSAYAETQEIVIKVPLEFTQEQVDFIKGSAVAQISSEMKKDLKIPKADIDAVEVKISALKTEMGIVDVVAEPEKPVEG